MDDIVLRAMAKWPNVPAVYGWLSLDRRGNWLLKGERITNEALNAFICRNYLRDDVGCWYFQNGPQQVFVALAYTPFVYRAACTEQEPLALNTHTGARVRTIDSVWMDEEGVLLIDADRGIGLIHDHDLDRLSPHLVDARGTPIHEDAFDEHLEGAESAPPLWLQFESRLLIIERIHSSEVARRFGFVSHPLEHAGV
jgi:hypothetical protein